MKITVINPDLDDRVTALMQSAAEAVAAPATQIVCASPPRGPRVINDAFTMALAGASILEEIARRDANDGDGYVIACFGDPAVHAAREISLRPVVGIGDASIALARTVARKFSIIGVGPWSRWVYEDAVAQTGAGNAVASIRTPMINSNDLVDDAESLYGLLAAEARSALESDGAEAIVLGCGAMVGMATRLQRDLGAPVIDPVQAGVKMIEAVAGLGASTSKTGSYRFPTEVSLVGLPDHAVAAFTAAQEQDRLRN